MLTDPLVLLPVLGVAVGVGRPRGHDAGAGSRARGGERRSRATPVATALTRPGDKRTRHLDQALAASPRCGEPSRSPPTWLDAEAPWVRWSGRSAPPTCPSDRRRRSSSTSRPRSSSRSARFLLTGSTTKTAVALPAGRRRPVARPAVPRQAADEAVQRPAPRRAHLAGGLAAGRSLGRAGDGRDLAGGARSDGP